MSSIGPFSFVRSNSRYSLLRWFARFPGRAKSSTKRWSFRSRDSFSSFFLFILPRHLMIRDSASTPGNMMIFTGQMVGEISGHCEKLGSLMIISTSCCIRLKGFDGVGGFVLYVSLFPRYFKLRLLLFIVANFLLRIYKFYDNFLIAIFEICSV